MGAEVHQPATRAGVRVGRGLTNARWWAIGVMPTFVVAWMPAAGKNPHYWPMLLLAMVMAVLLSMIGALYLVEPDSRRMGFHLILSALLFSGAGVKSYDSGILPIVGEICQSLFFLTVGLACLLVERTILQNWYSRAWVTLAILLLPVSNAILWLLIDPQSMGYSPQVTSIKLVRLSIQSVELTYNIVELGYLFLAVTFAAALYATITALGKAERSTSMPLLVGGVVLALTSALMQEPVMSATANLEAILIVQMLQGCVGITVPLALFAASAWRRWRIIALADHLARALPAPTIDGVQQAVRTTAGIDNIDIWLWIPAGMFYLGLNESPLSRQAIARIESGDADSLVHLSTADGRPLAVFHVQGGMRAHLQRISRVSIAARHALSIVQLQANRVEEMRVIQQRFVTLEEEGRRSVARDLHDGVQQHLLALKLDLGRLQWMRSPIRDGRDLEEIIDRVDVLVEEVRQISRGVHPPMLVELGLEAALEEHSERLGQQIDMHCSLSAELSPPIELALYYAISEAVTNTHKHAAATSVTIWIIATNGEVRAMVTDDGQGGARIRPGGGLEGVRARVQALRGAFRLFSSPAIGTRILVTIPLGG